MMWYYGKGGGQGWENMMSGGYGYVFLLFHLVVFVDLVLVGIWLWKQIKKK